MQLTCILLCSFELRVLIHLHYGHSLPSGSKAVDVFDCRNMRLVTVQDLTATSLQLTADGIGNRVIVAGGKYVSLSFSLDS